MKLNDGWVERPANFPRGTRLRYLRIHTKIVLQMMIGLRTHPIDHLQNMPECLRLASTPGSGQGFIPSLSSLAFQGWGLRPMVINHDNQFNF
jgi:hypothetical protein